MANYDVLTQVKLPFALYKFYWDKSWVRTLECDIVLAATMKRLKTLYLNIARNNMPKKNTQNDFDEDLLLKPAWNHQTKQRNAACDVLSLELRLVWAKKKTVPV